MDRARVDELWERRLAGQELIPADERALLEALQADPELRAELLEDERLDGTLAMLDRDPEEFLRAFDHRLALEKDADRFAATLAPRLTRRRVARPSDSRAWIAAAVLILAAAAVLLWRPSEPPPSTQARKAVAPAPEPKVEVVPRPPEPPPVSPRSVADPAKERARIEEELKAAVKPAAAPAPAPPPAPAPSPTPPAPPVPAPPPTRVAIARLEGAGDLLAGQRVEGRAAILFPDGTRVELGADTTVREITVEAGKTILLDKGSLRAEVTRQPKDRPMVVQTPHGEAKVVGTTLRVSVDPDPKKGTRLEVDEGKVEFRSGGRRVVVDAGQYAIAASGVPLAAKRPPVSFDLDPARPQLLKPRLEFGDVIQTPEGPVVRSTPNRSTLWSSEIAYWAGSEDVLTFTMKKGTTLRFRYFLRKPSEVNFRIKNLTKREYFTLDFQGVVGRWVTVQVPVADIPVITDGLKVACEPGDKYGRFSFLVGTPEQPADIDIAEFRILEFDR